jgi:hypothetical protein
LQQKGFISISVLAAAAAAAAHRGSHQRSRKAMQHQNKIGLLADCVEKSFKGLSKTNAFANDMQATFAINCYITCYTMFCLLLSTRPCMLPAV